MMTSPSKEPRIQINKLPQFTKYEVAIMKNSVAQLTEFERKIFKAICDQMARYKHFEKESFPKFLINLCEYEEGERSAFKRMAEKQGPQIDIIDLYIRHYGIVHKDLGLTGYAEISTTFFKKPKFFNKRALTSLTSETKIEAEEEPHLKKIKMEIKEEIKKEVEENDVIAGKSEEIVVKAEDVSYYQKDSEADEDVDSDEEINVVD